MSRCESLVVTALLASAICTGAQAATADDIDNPAKAQAALYLDNCAGCHQPLGIGIPGAIPALSGNAAVNATVPNDVIMAILNGRPGGRRYGPMPAFAAKLGDKQVADLANYVRTAWSNHATPDATPELVADLRSKSAVSGPGTEAAVAFECPQAGVNGAPVRLPGARSGIYDVLNGASAGTIMNKVDETIRDLRAQNVDPALIVDTLIGAYCPLVAAETGLTDGQKRERVDRFGQQVTSIVFADTQEPVRDVLVTVPLSPGVLSKVDDAAHSARMSRDSWLAQTIGKALSQK